MPAGKATTHKTHVFGLQTTRGINAGSEYFGIRSVRDARFRYIRNLTPKATFQNAATKDPTFKTWEKMAASGDTNAQKLVHDYQHRTAEELFDCETDPNEWHNLAAKPGHAAVIAEHKKWLPKTDVAPAPGSAHRVLTYDPATDEAVWEGTTVKRKDPIPQ